MVDMGFVQLYTPRTIFSTMTGQLYPPGTSSTTIFSSAKSCTGFSFNDRVFSFSKIKIVLNLEQHSCTRTYVTKSFHHFSPQKNLNYTLIFITISATIDAPDTNAPRRTMRTKMIFFLKVRYAAP
jgi:hypothetical protein